MMKVVNVVGSGSLGVELDLEKVAADIDSVDFDPTKYPGCYLRISEDAPLIIFYRTGKYITTGAESKEESFDIREQFLALLKVNEVITEAKDQWYQIQNYVCTADLGKKLNLNLLALRYGLEHTEYEPEQFPGLIYRPAEAECVVLMFANGKVVITGCPGLETAEAMFDRILEEVGSFCEE